MPASRGRSGSELNRHLAPRYKVWLQAFVRFTFSPEAQAILKANGFIVLAKPLLGGPGKPPLGLF